MNASSAVLGCALVLNVLYVAVSVYAFAHVDAAKRSRQSIRLLAITLWWPFYDIYDAEGTRIKPFGMALLLLTAAAYVLYAAMR